MAELYHTSHHHPLLFNEDTTRPNYFCYGCDKKVQGQSYSCVDCRFYLHKSCAEAPSEINDHPFHRHHPPLLLLPPSEDPETKVRCSFCRNYNKVEGFIYGCSSCDFFLDINCALLPHDTSGKFIETVHVAHPHPLVSINRFGYFYCRICRGSILDDASYACFECREFFHKQCIELPSTIDHPCHRRHQLLLADVSDRDLLECNMCQFMIQYGYYYRCVPCRFNIHAGCAWPPPIVEDKSRHDHPFTLLLRPNKIFDCDACGNQGTYVSYVCSTCNIQVHKECVSLPRHIRHNLHPHPISHCFFIRTDHNDSRDWDCKICFKKVDIDHGSYYCSRPDCDFIIHVKCSIENSILYEVVELEHPDEYEESDLLSGKSRSSIVRVIKEIKVGDDEIAGEIEHVSHKHNLIFSDQIKDNKYCNGCVLPILSSFYYCPQCDFFLHKTCAELQTMCRLWFKAKPFSLLTDGIFQCTHCRYTCGGFSYRVNNSNHLCLRCALVPHSFTYEADKPHFIFYDNNHREKCSACSKYTFKAQDGVYRCKDCPFAVHRSCVTLPRTAWHKCDQHSLTLAFQDPDDYPLRHYCDICEEARDPQQWFYHCETCDKAMHIECVLGEHPFIPAGDKYTYSYHKHPDSLISVRKIYYYPLCNDCGKPCQDLALECVEHGCEYIVHWSCINYYV